MVTSNAIVQHCIIKVTDYTVSNPPNNGKKIICVTALTVIKNGAEVGSKLGNPVPLKSGAEQGQGGNNIPYDILFYIEFLSHFYMVLCQRLANMCISVLYLPKIVLLSIVLQTLRVYYLFILMILNTTMIVFLQMVDRQ